MTHSPPPAAAGQRPSGGTSDQWGQMMERDNEIIRASGQIVETNHSKQFGWIDSPEVPGRRCWFNTQTLRGLRWQPEYLVGCEVTFEYRVYTLGPRAVAVFPYRRPAPAVATVNGKPQPAARAK